MNAAMQKQKSTKRSVPGARGKTSEGNAYAVLVGDVLQSTRFPDQKALFNGLRQQFEWVNERVAAVQPLGFTIGDEFQAAYSDVVSAFRAVLLLRLKFRAMKSALDQAQARMSKQQVRIGLSYGEISVFQEDSEPFGQSGEAWWNARKAIEHAEGPRSQHNEPLSSLTRFHGPVARLTAMTNAFWLAIDQVLFRMDRTDVEITLAMLTGRKQVEIAAMLGLSQPVISRRAKRNGVFTVLKVLEELVGIP
jgi:hypothetical protein